MLKIFYPSLVLLLCYAVTARGQSQIHITTAKDYNGVSFITFAEQVESTAELRFFFDKEWVAEAVVIQSKHPCSIHDVLQQTLAPLGLDYIFLYEKYIIIVNAAAEAGNPAIHVLSGVVKNGETGEALPGSTVYISGIDNSIRTGNDGAFSVKVPAGIQHIFFNATGAMQAYRTVRVNKNTEVEIELFQQVTELEEIEIAENAIQPVQTLELGAQHFTNKELKTIPPLFGEVDVIRSALSLPGVKSVGEGASGFNVRGGNVDQNLILIDNAPIYNSSHLFGLFSIVNSESLSGFTLHKGTMPARYGGRLSSVMDITFQDGMNQPLAFEGSLGAINSKIRFSAPIIKDKTSIAITARGAYPGWMLDIVPDKDIKNSTAAFYDASVKLAHRLNDKNFVSLTLHGSTDSFRLGKDTTYTWSGKLASLQWSHVFSSKMNSHFTAFYSRSENNVSAQNFADGFELASFIQTSGLSYNIDWDASSSHHLSIGLSVHHTSIGRGTLRAAGNSATLQPLTIPKEQGLEPGLYVSDAITFSPALSMSLGIRLSSFLFLGPTANRRYEEGLPKNDDTYVGEDLLGANEVGQSYTNLEPRIAMRYLIDAVSSVKGGYNKNFQYITLLSNTTAVSPMDTWKLSDAHLRPQQSDHFSIGYFRTLLNMFEASFEVYYKHFSNITQYKEGAQLLLNEHVETDLLHGTGKSYGAEFYLKKNYGKTTGSLGYTYSRSFVKVKGNFEEETLSDGNFFPSNFDKPHDMNVLVNYAFSKKTNVSANFVYSTGRPITYPESVYVVDGYVVANYGSINQERIPDYHRLDVSINHTMLPKRSGKFETSWVLGVYNFYARKNPFSVFFKPQYSGKYPQAYKLSVLGTIVPYFSLNFRIK